MVSPAWFAAEYRAGPFSFPPNFEGRFRAAPFFVCGVLAVHDNQTIPETGIVREFVTPVAVSGAFTLLAAGRIPEPSLRTINLDIPEGASDLDFGQSVLHLREGVPFP